MKRFSMAVRLKMVERLTGVNAVSAAQLSRETGITQQSLSRWLSQARNLPMGMDGVGLISDWTVDEKSRILARAALLGGDELRCYLATEGVQLTVFRRWRTALEEAGTETVGMAKQIGKLQRELARKERALAEATTLLLLRETVGNRVECPSLGSMRRQVLAEET